MVTTSSSSNITSSSFWLPSSLDTLSAVPLVPSTPTLNVASWPRQHTGSTEQKEPGQGQMTLGTVNTPSTSDAVQGGVTRTFAIDGAGAGRNESEDEDDNPCHRPPHLWPSDDGFVEMLSNREPDPQPTTLAEHAYWNGIEAIGVYHSEQQQYWHSIN